jgi:hypothetical protein
MRAPSARNILELKVSDFKGNHRSRQPSLNFEQHKYGPFAPIRAKVNELAAASGTTNAGEPDNGSGVAEASK